MALVFFRVLVFIVFNIFIVHTQEFPPIQLDANQYLTCLQHHSEQLTCDVTTFLEDFTNLILQTISEENVECGENGILDQALEAYFHGINFEDFEEGSLEVVTQLMSQCLEHQTYRDPDFVEALRSFISALKEVSIRSKSISSDDANAANVPSGRYIGKTKYNDSDPLARRKSEPMNIHRENKPNSALAAASNHNNQGQHNRASKPADSAYSLFASSFFENVSTSKPLQGMFNTIMMTNSAKRDFYNAFYRASKKFGLPNPGLFASTVAQAVGDTFYSLSSCSFMNAMSSSIGQYLYNSEVLNIDNYLSLAVLLANELNNSLTNVPMSSRDVFLTHSLAIGIVRFLHSLGLFHPRNAPLFAKYLANELLFSKENASVCQYKGTAESPNGDFFNELHPLSQNKGFNKENNQRFSTILLQRLWESEKCLEFFNLQLSAEEASAASYDYIYQLASSLDMSYSSDIANGIAEAVSSSLHSSQWYSFASVMVISLEKFLSAHSFLTAYNTETLAEAYLDELDTVKLNSHSTSYIDVLLKATYHFVVNHFVLDTENSNSFGSLLINELKSTDVHEPPVSSSAVENNSTAAMVLQNNFPEVYSPSGLISKKASARVKDLAKDLALTFLPNAGFNVESFTNLFLSTLSEINSENPGLKTESALLETLLEMISASLGIIENSKFIAFPKNSRMNLALSKAMRSAIV